MVFRHDKKYGQNFLTDTNLLSAIVNDSGITFDDTVVEVGAGAGALTAQIAKKAKQVISYEIDKRLETVLESNLSGLSNVQIIYGDALKNELPSELKPYGYKVVANLPYYITTPLLFWFLERDNPPSSLTVMVQEEVALRMSASPATPDYGALSAVIALRGTAKMTRKVGRNMFSPPPNVDSAVVRIDLNPPEDNIDYAAVTRVIRAAFAMRRKTLVNNLMLLGLNRENAVKAVEAVGLKADIRGERLGTKEFVEITRQLGMRIMQNA
ncbi:MAG: 16S rRNA (adenine(1518)-N(6)/adenine(1519)-N(6))-dimethyltransferase RsmA [Firmicutes bacterium]|nr:16S rRNA (adenine(1518)-N(6)/adenine(1519)-N(6))-dimethyltransferase RsmA [Bacillota bacterium]